MSVRLSLRLQRICDFVPDGSTICDVGCDHALVDITLLQNKRITHALAMDVADGPLAIARQNVELTGLSDRCEIRKSDGLQAFEPGEADTLIIAGMGGILMRRILEEEGEEDAEDAEDKKEAVSENKEHIQHVSSLERVLTEVSEDKANKFTIDVNTSLVNGHIAVRPCDAMRVKSSSCVSRVHTGEKGNAGYKDEGVKEGDSDGDSPTRVYKAASFRQLILSPQSEPWQVREWLRQNDIGITREALVEEDGKFYQILYCEPGKPGVHPDWEKIAMKVAQLPAAQLASLSINEKIRQSILTMLRTPSFRQQVEDDYGPCLIANRDRILEKYVFARLRQQLGVLTVLQLAADKSGNAQKRLMEIQTEVGVLQVLLFLLNLPV